MRYRITKINVTQAIDWLSLDLLTALTQLTVTEVAFTLLSLTCSPSFSLISQLEPVSAF